LTNFFFSQNAPSVTGNKVLSCIEIEGTEIVPHNINKKCFKTIIAQGVKLYQQLRQNSSTY
jgi:hypothetical protein